MSDPNQPDPVQTRLDQLKLSLLDSKGLRKIPSPEPLIEGYLFKDSLAWIGGQPGSCKSFIAAEAACCIATGRPWFGHHVTKGKVLYLIAEGVSGFSDRIEAWEEYYGEDADGVTFLPVPVQFINDTDFAAFGQLVIDLAPDWSSSTPRHDAPSVTKRTTPATWVSSSNDSRRSGGPLVAPAS
jgi:hypothetical protein